MRCIDGELYLFAAGVKGRVAALGSSAREALLRVAEQVDVPEVTDFIEAVIKAQDEHLSIGETLERQAEHLRQKASLR